MYRYIVAIYLRLSVDDKRVESMSIESQRLLLRKYAEILGDNVEIIEYVDNGYSGTNFERPAVQQLLNDVKTYKVNCILVKDFSRFGRNSIEVGYFTQQIFPLFGVRFISVSDNYDSDEHKGDTGGIAVAVKYLVNEYYSRDLSVKTKSAKYTKMRRGEYKSGNYTYGYKAGDNGEQIIDEKAAETVKMIFELTADGKSAAYISKLLFDKNIPTPAQYKGIKGNYGSRFPNCKYWSISTINRIIVNEQYMGMFVMLKQKVQDVGSTKMIKRDESEWIKIPNHHESIVSKELFERANAVRRTFKQPNKQQRSYPLRGKVECGCCKHAMDYVPRKIPVYICRYTINDETEPCYKSEITEGALNQAIFDIISKQAESILNIDDVSKVDTAQIRTEQLADIEKQIAACQKKKQLLYEQLLTEEITLDEYKQLKLEMDTKTENYRIQYDKFRKSEERSQLETENTAKIILTAKAVKKETALTQALADMLIEKVCIYPDNRLEIVWKIKDFCTESAAEIN